MTRIPQITQAEALTSDQQEVWSAILESRGVVRGPFSVLLHSPELALRIAEHGTAARFHSGVHPRLLALACLLTARHFDCQYAWSSNVGQAQRIGLPDDVITAIRDGRRPQLQDDESIVFSFVHELLASNRVTETTFTQARALFDVRTLVELVAFVGYYADLAMILNTFEVSPAPHFAELLPTELAG